MTERDPIGVAWMLAVCVALFHGSIAASGAIDEIEEIVVIGTRIEGGAFQSDTQHTLEREDLQVMVPAEPEQFLQRLPGVTVYRPGGPGGVSEVFLRGAESNFTAVYVDGVRLNNPANTRGGSFDFSTLAAREVERVDIAMGAMSALYGSDAMAGVMRIQTAWPAAGGREAYLEAGTERDWRAGVAGTLEMGEDAVLGIRAAGVNGAEAVEGSTLELTSFAARLAGGRDGGDRWFLQARHVDRNRTGFPEVSGGPLLARLPNLETADGRDLDLSALLQWSASPGWSIEVTASWAELEDDIQTPPVAAGVLDPLPGFTTVSEYRRAQLLWINRITTGRHWRFAFGADLVDESGRDDGAVDLGFAVIPNRYRLDRTSASAFLELGRSWAGDVEASVAMRFDDADDASRVSGKLGLVKAFPDHQARVWAHVANGFKLPSFFALGNPLFGNPDLVVEKVRSLELGIERKLHAGLSAGLALFSSEYEDLVDFDFETFIHVNRGQTDISGVQLFLRAQWGTAVSLHADATLSDITSTSGPLRRRPERSGVIGLTWRPSASWAVNAAARYAGERLLTSIPTGDVTEDAYLALDATISFRQSERTALWLAVDNVLDADYQDAPGFPAPGVRARLGIEVRF